MNQEETLRKEAAFILELRHFILDHIEDTKLNGDVIGHHFGLSRSHLHRKLKALTNQSVSEFAKGIRLQKALELIQAKDMSISEIAYKTGFSSISYFSRTFKKAYGKPPSQIQTVSYAEANIGNNSEKLIL